MTAAEELMQDEQVVLAILLAWPRANRWELDGLEASLFLTPVHRRIAVALITLRDSGRSVHWKRVRLALRKRGDVVAADLCGRLTRAIGTECGLTAAVSRIHAARARRKAA